MPTKDWHLSPEDHAELYLTDEQYLRLLVKVKETVNKPDFEVHRFDSTFPGDKYTESNCGLCNDEFCELDMALFPEQFPERKTTKYREQWHKCPFDTRPMTSEFKSGCFYTCYLFDKQYGEHDVELMKEMIEETFWEVEEWQKS